MSADTFWTGKTPCWKMHDCPVYLVQECPAFQFQVYPCWEVEGTYCKLNLREGRSDDVSNCYNCNVYMTYSDGSPIRIKKLCSGLMHSKLLRLLMEQETYRRCHRADHTL